ncbi:MAG: hypothetical protein Q8O67_09030 [Deltaproteobacteria bacterium]|nr:hypothetical protein [Deltaproteobacteria bacterium]
MSDALSHVPLPDRASDRLAESLAVVAWLRGVAHPAAATHAATHIAAGAAPADALRAAGLDERVAAAVAVAPPGDLPAALAEVARALGAFDRRRQLLQATGIYAAVVAVAAGGLALLALTQVIPALAEVARFDRGTGVTSLPALVGLAMAAVALVGSLTVIVHRAPKILAGDVDDAWQTALVLAGASAFARAVTTTTTTTNALPLYLRAGAQLAQGRVRSSTMALADALDRGADVAAAAAALLGPVGGAFFAHAASRGAAVASLHAVAAQAVAHADAAAIAGLALVRRRTLLLAGAALLVAGIGLLWPYTQALLGGAR